MTSFSPNLNRVAAFIIISSTALFFLILRFNSAAIIILVALLLYSIGKSLVPTFLTATTALVYFLATRLPIPWPNTWHDPIRMTATIFLWTMMLVGITLLTLYVTRARGKGPLTENVRDNKRNTANQDNSIN